MQVILPCEGNDFTKYFTVRGQGFCKFLYRARAFVFCSLFNRTRTKTFEAFLFYRARASTVQGHFLEAKRSLRARACPCTIKKIKTVGVFLRVGNSEIGLSVLGNGRFHHLLGCSTIRHPPPWSVTEACQERDNMTQPAGRTCISRGS